MSERNVNKKLKYREPIEIEWVDSCLNSGWRRDSEFLSETREVGHGLNHKTIGYFLYKNNEVIAVAQSINDAGEDFIQTSAERIIIPLVAVKKVRRISKK